MNTRPLHSYPRYFQDWLLSETRSRLNLAERGLFGDLCDLMATDGGSLLDDELALQKRAACTPREWRNAWPKVRQCFEVRDGRFYNSKLTYALDNAAKSFDARSAGGKATAELRWGYKLSGSSANSSANSLAVAQRLPSSSPTSSPTVPEEEHPLPPLEGELTLAPPEMAKPKRHPRTPKPERPAYTPEFMEFYDLYPKATTKAQSFEFYREHIKNGKHAIVMEGLRAALPQLLKAEEQYRPDPIRWLRWRRWEDHEHSPIPEADIAQPGQRQAPIDKLLAEMRAKNAM